VDKGGEDRDRIDDDDSDGETDGMLVEKASHPTPTFPFHDVRITSAAYTTYRSVLVWIYSGHISFAPLTSTLKNKKVETEEGHNQLESSAIQRPDLPASPSPKSVYRLAHYLGLDDLRKLALDSIASQITVNNVAQELFGDVGRTYEEVQTNEMDFAVKHWKEVKVTGGMLEVQRAITAGELDHSAGAIATKLAMRL
jgi:hypothetical protein